MSDEPSTPTGDDDPGAIKGMFAPSSISRADKRLEIIAGILLALSTIAIAWSGLPVHALEW